LWLTVSSDSGSTAANATNDTLTIAGGTGISTSVLGDTLTITNDSPATPDQNLWETITADTGSAVANTTTDNLTIAGSGIISTAIVGDTLTISSAGTPDQNIWLTVVGDSGSAVANTTTDTLTIAGGTNVSTAVVGDTLTINTTAEPDQSLWATINSDSGSTVANTTTDTLTIAGGTNVSTSVVGDILTIDATGVTQNLWETIVSDSNSAVANLPTDTLTIAGGTAISTAFTGDTLTITNSAPNVDQNIWTTIQADSDAANPNSTSTTLTIAGGTNITTSVIGQTLTINTTAEPDQFLWASFVADSGSTGANSTTDQLTVSGGTGISTAIVGDTLTITNDSPATPDQNLFESVRAVQDGVTIGTITAATTTDFFSITADAADGIEIEQAAQYIRIKNLAPYPGEVLPTLEYAEGLGGQTQTFVWNGSTPITPWTTHTSLTFTPPGTGSQYYIVEWCAEINRNTAFTLVEGRFRSGPTSELSRAASDPGTTLAYGNFSGFSSVTLTGGVSHTFYVDFRPSEPAFDDPYGDRTAFMRNVRIKAQRVDGPI
jgi:cytoskeletal protein CcmA (bactofilin family)